MASASGVDLALSTVGTVGDARNVIGNTLMVVGRAYNLTGLTAFDRAQLDTARVALERWYDEIRLLAGNVAYRAEFQQREYLITLALKLVKGVADVVRLRDEKSWTSFVTGLPTAFAEALGYTLRTALETAGKGAGALGGGLVSGLGLAGTVVLALVIYLAYFHQGARA